MMYFTVEVFVKTILLLLISFTISISAKL